MVMDGSLSRALAARLCLAGLGSMLCLFEAPPAAAQWGDNYDRPRGEYAVPRRRPREGYYREDAPRRYAPQPQEAPRQFYWPWEDRPEVAQPQPDPGYRPPRQRAPAVADGLRGPLPPDGAREPRRRPRPAQAAQPAKPIAPKAAPSTQIAVFGDSLADHLARGLDDVFEDNSEVAILDRAKADSGLVRRELVDWPKAADEYLKANGKVGFALVMLGANDRQPIREGDQNLEPLSDRWREIYRDRVDALVKVFSDRKIPLVWVGVPPMKNESLSTDLAALNEIYRERVAKGGGTYVDIWPGFVDDRNRYAASGPDLEGQNARLRTGDGVHFTHAGARKLAHFADVELKRLMGTASPVPAEPPAAAVAATPGPALDGAGPRLDDTAAIDRQITAMLPSLPEPPGVPALPVKPAAGPVVPLGRPEISPGGILVSGRPRDGDTSGNVERSLQRGVPALPQPGRADDFRWPPG